MRSALVVWLALAAGCGGKGPSGGASGTAATAATANVDSVNIADASAAPVVIAGDPKAYQSFCDKHWPGEGPAAMTWKGPALKKLAGVVESAAPASAGRWTWVSFWATWCGPCLIEMPLIAKWRDGLQKDGVPMNVELWSIDDDAAALREKVKGGMIGPIGHVKWVESPAVLAAFLQTLGLNPDSAIPIQMLVDPNGKLRCVRVGSVHDDDWGTVRKLVGK